MYVCIDAGAMADIIVAWYCGPPENEMVVNAIGKFGKRLVGTSEALHLQPSAISLRLVTSVTDCCII